MEENNAVLGGRQLLLTFKKGGRIKEEHVYNSVDEDYESQFAIWTVLGMVADDGNVGPSVIGKGFIGVAPWDDLHSMQIRRGVHGPHTAEESHRRKAESFDFSTPLRVADCLEQPDGTVLMYIE